MPRVLALLFWLGMLLPSLSGSRLLAAARSGSACSPENIAGLRLVAVDPGFELLVEDGRRLWPAGIDPAPATRDDPQFGEHARRALAARLADTSILAPSPLVPPDRWGRIVDPIFVAAPGGAAPADIATMIVAAGWARVRPSAANTSCLPPLLRAEVTARAAGLGLWADPSYAVLSADAPDTFAGRFGTLQIVEGRVTSIGESGPRTYLNFGPRRGVDFTAVIARQNGNAFDKAGLALHGLVGRRVRVRGLLDDFSGPRIEINDPDSIEMIAGI